MERDYREVVQSWLDGNFDEATKDQIRELQANDPEVLRMHSTETLSSVQAVSAVSWVSEPTV